MSVWTAIATWLGRVFKEILPSLIAEYRKPKQTQFGGADEKLINDIDDSITDRLRRPKPDGGDTAPRRPDADN